VQGALCHIGALILAVLGKNHHIPVYISNAKKETDLFAQTKEICAFNGIKTAPKGTNGFVPLVEWVPAKYLKGK
jgi:methylthioribose-1-phosphate isomerase